MMGDLRSELSMLRGESIALFPMAPEEVPCHELSDSERLCKRPLVTVQMMAYKHEPYIAQAIESVLMQKTDFEFELIIGEDCSPDRTREICIEYQKKHPDKIRILWSENNVHAIGGNELRIRARSRGEFWAFCEGDDYWIDPLKLQKQVDVMRQNAGVTICAGGVKWLYQSTGAMSDGGLIKRTWKEGITPRAEAFSYRRWLATASLMIRKSAFDAAYEKFEIFKWRLMLSDETIWTAMMYFGDLYVTYDNLAVYRCHSGGVTKYAHYAVDRDSGVVGAYFAMKTGERSAEDFHRAVRQIVTSRCNVCMELPFAERRVAIQTMLRSPFEREVLMSSFGIFALWMMRLGIPLHRYLVYRGGILKRLGRLFLEATC